MTPAFANLLSNLIAMVAVGLSEARAARRGRA